MPAPITPNPGGTLHPDQVVGRDPIVARYWDILQNRSMVLLAPRRLGKTSVCKRMVEYPLDGFEARYRDLEGRTSSPMDLVRALFEDAEAYLSRTRLTAQRARRILDAFGGSIETAWANLKVDAQDWRALLEAILTDLNEWAANNGKTIVLFWDEFTLFLNDLIAAGPAGAQDAMTLLDRLRAARAQFPRVRMVYTGSIGLEEVLSVLRKQGYANDPTNDMATEILPLLEIDEATLLADRLLGSFQLVSPALSVHIAQICEGHPFLIQHVADRLRIAPPLRSESGAEAALETLLDETGDPLELSHYIERLEKYFPDPEHGLALEILDTLALRTAPVSFNDLRDAIGLPDRNALLRVLKVLRRDLYLTRTGRDWSFSLNFVRRYWMLERAL